MASNTQDAEGQAKVGSCLFGTGVIFLELDLFVWNWVLSFWFFWDLVGWGGGGGGGVLGSFGTSFILLGLASFFMEWVLSFGTGFFLLELG